MKKQKLVFIVKPDEKLGEEMKSIRGGTIAPVDGCDKCKDGACSDGSKKATLDVFSI